MRLLLRLTLLIFGLTLFAVTVTMTACRARHVTRLPAWIIFESDHSLYRIRPDGRNLAQLPGGTGTTPIVSPGSGWIAFTDYRGTTSDIFRTRLDSPVVQQLTLGAGNNYGPNWSPDGQWIAFYSDRDGNREIYRMQPDGTGVDRISTSLEGDLIPAWSPDSQWIAFKSIENGVWSVYSMRADGTDLRKLAMTPGSASTPIWSPDGRWIAFTGYEPGGHRIYRIHLDGSDFQVVNAAPNFVIHAPTWSPDGHWIAFVSEEGVQTYLNRIQPNGKGIQRLTQNLYVFDDRPNAPAWWSIPVSHQLAPWVLILSPLSVAAAIIRRGTVSVSQTTQFGTTPPEQG